MTQMLFNLSASALARLMQTHTDTHSIYNESSSSRTIEQAELMRRCRGRSHSCTPTLRSVLACLTLHLCVGGRWWGGGLVMACRVFVCTLLQTINAAFSSPARLQTVYRGIPLRLSTARLMPSLGWWPNGPWIQ